MASNKVSDTLEGDLSEVSNLKQDSIEVSDAVKEDPNEVSDTSKGHHNEVSNTSKGHPNEVSDSLEQNSNEVEDTLKRTQEIFQAYRVELDAKHDLHEKLVKKSRDITIESKRIIFLLHRDKNKEKVLGEAKMRLRNTYKAIAVGIGCLLWQKDIYQYLRAYSAGMQEFVEALSFYHYLASGELVSMDEITSGVCLFDKAVDADDLDEDKEVKKLPMSTLLTDMDYILGIADLTGELMRKCIASGNLEEPFQLRAVLKSINDAFLLIGNSGGRDLTRKASTLRSSLQKVENACYMIKVRGSEMEKLLAKNKGLSEKDIISLGDVFNHGHEVGLDCE